MILSKQLYLKNPIAKRSWIFFKLVSNHFLILFKRKRTPVLKLAQPLGLPKLLLPASHDKLATLGQQAVAICPSSALELSLNELGHVKSFQLNVLRCVSCGLCAQGEFAHVIAMKGDLAQANESNSNWKRELLEA